MRATPKVEQRSWTAEEPQAFLLEVFNNVARHHLTDKTGDVVQIFEAALTPLQQQILDLLDIPPNAYTATAAP